jgi:hypothetical protein
LHSVSGVPSDASDTLVIDDRVALRLDVVVVRSALVS